MGAQVSKDLPVTLQDVIDYDSWVLTPPDSLLGAQSLANQTSGTIPYNTRYDRRYKDSTIQNYGRDLLQYRGFGAGGYEGLSKIFGSTLTSFTFNTWVAGLSGTVSRTFTKVDAGSGTSFFSITGFTTGTGQQTITVTMTANPPGNPARNGAFYMLVSVGGSNVWQGVNVVFNQPSNLP